MVDDIKVNNYMTYKHYLDNLIGEDVANNLIAALGGDDKVMNATFGMNADSGSAYDGSFVYNAIMIAKYAKQLNDMLPEKIKVDSKSIYKVALLQHISKIIMYEKNDNDWEIKNRGILYKFVEQNTALRCGERSIFLLMQIGISLNENEFEAIRIVDKSKEEDSYAKYYSNTLAFVIRQANEMVSIINKQENKN